MFPSQKGRDAGSSWWGRSSLGPQALCLSSWCQSVFDFGQIMGWPCLELISVFWTTTERATQHCHGLTASTLYRGPKPFRKQHCCLQCHIHPADDLCRRTSQIRYSLHGLTPRWPGASKHSGEEAIDEGCRATADQCRRNAWSFYRKRLPAFHPTRWLPLDAFGRIVLAKILDAPLIYIPLLDSINILKWRSQAKYIAKHSNRGLLVGCQSDSTLESQAIYRCRA